jgi:translation initiation factor 2 alpha subunit (eIF-2alpha)
MNAAATTLLEASARRLFPSLNLEQVWAELLLERAQKNLIKYQTMARRFEARYGQTFASFRQTILDSQPAFEAEQDYFDWELAITGIEDMKREIARLNLNVVEAVLAALGLP